MTLSLDDFCKITATLLLVFTLGIITIYKITFKYWKNRQLFLYEEPSIPFGNVKTLFTERLNYGVFFKIVYDKIKFKQRKHGGAFSLFLPFYVLNDPEIIKNVLRSFDHFPHRLYTVDEEDDPFIANLAFVSGERWHCLRNKLAPAFTPGKIKRTFDIFTQCAYQMKKALDYEYENDQAVDIKRQSLRFTTDVIGAYAYGLECNSFKNPNSKFIIHAQKLISVSSRYRMGKIFAKGYFPKPMQWLIGNIYNEKSVEFFVNLAKDTAKFRKANNIVRQDVFQSLIDLEAELDIKDMDNKTSKSAKIIKEVASQVFLFFIAGSETSSITFSFCLYELAINPDIQQKLRDEIDRVLIKHGGKITYDAIMDMKYMSQVVDETLRKYPPVPHITRRCAKDFKMADYELVIPKKVVVVISTLGLHHDPDYYPEPEKFDPERFSEENKTKRLLSPTYLLEKDLEFVQVRCKSEDVIARKKFFNILAYRYGLTQIKVGLTVLLQHYLFSLNEKTTLPIQISGDSFTLMPKTAILLDIKKRNDNE